MSRAMVARATYVSVEMASVPYLNLFALAQTPAFAAPVAPFVIPWEGLREVVAHCNFAGGGAGSQPLFRVVFSTDLGVTEFNEIVTDPATPLVVVQPFATQPFYLRTRMGPVAGGGLVKFSMPITIPRGVNALRILAADVTATPGTLSITMTAGSAGSGAGVTGL
jgi:hypothetical protein